MIDWHRLKGHASDALHVVKGILYGLAVLAALILTTGAVIYSLHACIEDTRPPCVEEPTQ